MNERPMPLPNLSKNSLMIALAVIVFWTVSALFLDAALLALLPLGLQAGAQAVNVVFAPILWVVVIGVGLVLVLLKDEPLAPLARALIYLLAVWAASTLLIEILAIVIGHYQPRLMLTGSGVLPFLGGTPQSVWGVLAAGLIRWPQARTPILALGVVAAGLKVASAEAYLGDVVLSCVLCLGVAKMMAGLYPSCLPGPTPDSDTKSE